MRTRFIQYLVPLMALAACRGEQQPVQSGGPIELTAGMPEGSARVETKVTGGTQIALQVNGTWKETVTQPTTATVASETITAGVYALTCAPVLYWDDYGTADPDNTAGRAAGLTIYGAAVDGLATAPSVTDWTALPWTLNVDQTGGWASKDLLISNNVKGDNTYKFTERSSGKQLTFTHALSQITVNLTAGDGFAGGEFAAAPKVWLYGNWAYTTGTLDITTGAFSDQAGAAEIELTKTALVIPGSAFASDEALVLKINADGNIYYVTAREIRAAISAAPYVTEAGKNYIFNVTLNKTGITVTASVTDWIDVESTEVKPVIDVNVSYGGSGSSSSPDGFAFYRSTSLNNGYSKDSAVAKDNDKWTMTPQLYWPDHNTHYQFRGVWPADAEVKKIADVQVIEVQNVPYTEDTFPSDLQIARPEIAEGVECSNTEPDHTRTYLYSGGICATEGTVNLNFRYIMSQVEVNLSTTTGDDQVRLEGAVVELLNVYNTAQVKLGDRSVVPTGEKGSFDCTATGAVVPQDLDGVRFRIVITNEDGTTDHYYADVVLIKASGSTELVAPDGKWNSGVHYVYNLKLSKTKVLATATLANWTTVTADENVLF